MKTETGELPGGYWNRKQLQYALTLEEFAKDFAANGQVQEATQIHLVLYGKTKELALAEGIQPPAGLSPEDEAQIEAQVAAMRDEELERAAEK
jgi:hypothetical protein